MRQVLIPDYKDNKCPYCDGRGFFLIQQRPGNNLVPPHSVVECKFCSGTGNATLKAN